MEENTKKWIFEDKYYDSQEVLLEKMLHCVNRSLSAFIDYASITVGGLKEENAPTAKAAGYVNSMQDYIKRSTELFVKLKTIKEPIHDKSVFKPETNAVLKETEAANCYANSVKDNDPRKAAFFELYDKLAIRVANVGTALHNAQLPTTEIKNYKGEILVEAKE